jgi:hypothetical protein
MLLRMLANIKRAARRKTFLRISERFLNQGLTVLGPGAGSPSAPGEQSQRGGETVRKFK